MPTFLLDFFKVRLMDVSDPSVTDADLAAYEPGCLSHVMEGGGLGNPR